MQINLYMLLTYETGFQPDHFVNCTDDVLHMILPYYLYSMSRTNMYESSKCRAYCSDLPSCGRFSAFLCKAADM